MGKPRKTTEQFKQDVYGQVGNEYTVLGEYVTNRIKIKMRHNICNNTYEVTPDKFLSGRRCPLCSSNKKKTTIEFKQEVYNQVGNEYTVLGEYTTTHTKIKMKHNCTKCNNHEFEMKPNNFLNGQRCPICFGKFKRTTDQFKQEVYNQVGNEYTVLGEYVTNETKIKVRHNCIECNNYEYDVRPHDFLAGYRCPACFGTPRKSIDQFKQEVYNQVGNEYTVLGEYENNHTHILMRHNCIECNNHEYYVTPTTFLHNRCRCPECSRNKNESYACKYITQLLNENNIKYAKEYKFDDCKNVNKLPYDFIIRLNDTKFLLEYDGRQHFDQNCFNSTHNEFMECRKRDEIKNQYCIENNITLIRIPYTEDTNLESILNNILALNLDKLTNCMIVKDSIYMNIPEIYKQFINQGDD